MNCVRLLHIAPTRLVYDDISYVRHRTISLVICNQFAVIPIKVGREVFPRLGLANISRGCYNQFLAKKGWQPYSQVLPQAPGPSI